MGGDVEDRPFLLSNRCKILSAVSLVVVIAELLFVWETKIYVPNTEFQKMSQAKVSHATMSTRQGKPTTTEKPEVPEVAQIQRLPSGGVRLSQDLQNELNRRLKAAIAKKVIIIWLPEFGSKYAYGAKRTFAINAFKCGNCEVTFDRNKINDENVGAVMFRFDALNATIMPPKRNPKQLYIYRNRESTATLRVVRGLSLKFEDSFKFNATMTNRRDSGFYTSYASKEDIVGTNALSLEELLKMKTKVAVAIVSNCRHTPGARTRIKMFNELMSLNFGMEGHGKCFKDKGFPARNQTSFGEEIRKYKFYFSFENSYHCKDYITEKFFVNALKSLAVPVVWGATKEEYEAVGPPGSFIFAEDFSSMKELSEYLKYLNGNDTAYLEYFRWLRMKPSDMPQYGRARKWCNVCRALHGINIDDVYNPKFDENHLTRPLFTDGIAKRTVEHLIQWYYGEDHPECFGR